MNRFRRDEQIGWIRQQADACRELDSPLWGAVLDAMAQDVAVGGPTLRVLQARPDSRFGDAVALRLIGCAHRLALSGHAPDLAAFLPSCGGRADANEATTEVLRLVEERATDFIAALNGPPQTNEVGRAAGLVLGLLWASRRFEHPLRLREMGCSGGLNLRMDAFHFSHGKASMGPPDSPVKLNGVWDRAPELADLVIADRAGCDPAPVDVTTAAGALWLQSFVWPDQTARFTRLNGAIGLAGRLPARVEQADDTVAWLRRELADPPAGLTTIVYHSIVWQYIDKPERERIAAVLADTGRQATAAAPFLWLQFEPDHLNRASVSITLRAWPGDVYIRLGSADFHGRWVRTGG